MLPWTYYCLIKVSCVFAYSKKQNLRFALILINGRLHVLLIIISSIVSKLGIISDF